MKRFVRVLWGGLTLTLSACSGGDAPPGDKVANVFEAKADQLEQAADSLSNETQKEALEDRAEDLREAAEKRDNRRG
jgi:hypothetical protein